MLKLFVSYPIESIATIATLPAILSFIYRSTFKQGVVRYFFFYLVAKLCIESIMFYMASKGIENLYLGNTLTIVSFFLFARMFQETYESRARRIVVEACEFIFIVVLSYDLVRDGMSYTFRYTGLAECVFIMLFCLMYFYELIRHPTIPYLPTYPFFWVCAGLITYFAPCTFITPWAFYLDRWPTNESMHIFVLVPYALEIFFLSLVSFGIFVSKQ